MKRIRIAICALLCLALAAPALAYTDDGKIVHQDAVKECTSLGIVQGRENGSFAPQALVTRGEVAKMMVLISWGGADLRPQTDPGVFSDLANHWAKGYAVGCYQAGLMSGYGNGVFAPDAPTTGYEAGRILLELLGYDSKTEGFTGENWQVGVDRCAQQAGLFHGLNVDKNAPLTRDSAVVMIANALGAKTVEYVQQLVSVDGILQSTTVLKQADTTTRQARFSTAGV